MALDQVQEEKTVRAQLKQFLARVDVDDTGVLTSHEFIELCQSFGIEFATGTKQSLETEYGDINYRVYVDRLQQDEAGKWKLIRALSKTMPQASSLKSRFTYISEANTALNDQFNPKPTDPYPNRKPSNPPARRFDSLLQKMTQAGMDHRLLNILPFVFKRVGTTKVGLPEFESILGTMKFNAPAELQTEILLELQEDGVIAEASVKALLTESQYVNGAVKKGDTSGQITDVIAPGMPILLTRDIERNIHLVLDKLQSKFRLFRDYFRHFDRERIGRINKDGFEAGLVRLNIFLTATELAELFGYLDQKRQGYIEYQDFAAIKNEVSKVDRNTWRRSLDHPYIKYNTANIRHKFNDAESVNESLDSKSRKALYFGNRGSRRAMSPIPSDANPQYAYGSKTQTSDDIGDVLSMNYQREYIERIRQVSQSRLQDEHGSGRRRLKVLSVPGRKSGARHSATPAPSVESTGQWKMRRFTNQVSRWREPRNRSLQIDNLPAIS